MDDGKARDLKQRSGGLMTPRTPRSQALAGLMVGLTPVVTVSGMVEVAVQSTEQRKAEGDRLLKQVSLSLNEVDGNAMFAIVRESKIFLELVAIDLGIDAAFELVQMQRQPSRWHGHWIEVWATDVSRLEISTLAQTWTTRIREMAVARV